MAKISVIRNTYGSLDYLQNALDYVTDDRANYIGGYGVNYYDTAAAYNQMVATKQYFNKVSSNPLVHIVVAYNNQVQDINTAAVYGQKCAEYFFNRFQVLYCTHAKDFNCGYYHTHIVINSVSYINGHMIQTGYDEMYAYCNYVSKVTGQKCSFYFDNKADYSN